MAWDHAYRQLEKDEVIREGDEVLDSDSSVWEPAAPHTVGLKAPDPRYPAHRWYRRLKDAVSDGA